MLDLLPKEICLDILLRLPIKTLVICACTSKPLLKFLTSPDFVSTHIKKSKENQFIHLRYFKYIGEKGGRTNEYFALQPDNESFNGEFDVKEMPITDRANHYLTVVGSYNGVICLSDDNWCYANVFYLWNPSIRKAIRLPCPNYTHPKCGNFDACVGFGFDEVTGDYKVVRLVYRETMSVRPRQYPLVEVYTVSGKAWRKLKGPSPIYCIRSYYGDSNEQTYSNCCLNGVVHWPGYNEFSRVWSAIVTFDVAEECFGEMVLPDSLKDLSNSDFELTVTNCWGMLGLVRRPRPHSFTKSSSCLWVMKEYGNVDTWTLLFNFDEPTKYSVPKALYFRQNMDILMLAVDLNWEKKWGLSWERNWDRKSRTGVFSIGNGKVEAEVLGHLDFKVKGLYLGSYQESLALFCEAKAVQEDEVTNDASEEKD